MRYFLLNPTPVVYYPRTHTKQRYIKLCLSSSSATYLNGLEPPARCGRARSIQITHRLAAWVPSMPNQSAAIDGFNVLQRTPRLCACVCLWKENLEKALFSVCIIPSAGITHHRWQEIWRWRSFVRPDRYLPSGISWSHIGCLQGEGMGRGYLLRSQTGLKASDNIMVI